MIITETVLKELRFYSAMKELQRIEEKYRRLGYSDEELNDYFVIMKNILDVVTKDK